MIDPTKIDFNQLPKKFADGAIGAYNKDSFFFGVTSGNNIDVFATTPRVMKDVAMFLARHIENYEKQFGIIDMSVPPIPSPLQPSDFSNNENN